MPLRRSRDRDDATLMPALPEPGAQPGALEPFGADAPAPFDEDPDHDDDVVYISDEPGVVRRSWTVVAFLLLLVFGVFSLGAYWVHGQINPAGTGQGTGEEVAVEIPPDSGLTTIARLLEESEVITSATIFKYYARLKDVGGVRPGRYDKLHKRDSMDNVVARLKQGPAAARFSVVNIPEGWWVTETATRLKEKFPKMNDVELAKAMQTVRSRYQPQGAIIDGFLFPATYRVEEKDDDNEVKMVEQMTGKFDQVADEVGLADVPAHLGDAAGKTVLSSYDVLKVAALVESEAKVPEDRPRVARVIYNRIKKGWRLDIDATVSVALGQHKEKLTNDDLAVDSPYNLRKYPGLTPTPINSPGQASIEAALNPSTEPNVVNALYYVLSDKQGHHTFADNDRDFQTAVRKAQKDGLL